MIYIVAYLRVGMGTEARIVGKLVNSRMKTMGWAHLTIIKVMAWPCGSLLPQRLMTPSPKSQVMCASAFSPIGDFFWYF